MVLNNIKYENKLLIDIKKDGRDNIYYFEGDLVVKKMLGKNQKIIFC
jgi:hypothetical protein